MSLGAAPSFSADSSQERAMGRKGAYNVGIQLLSLIPSQWQLMCHIKWYIQKGSYTINVIQRGMF